MWSNMRALTTKPQHAVVCKYLLSSLFFVVVLVFHFYYWIWSTWNFIEKIISIFHESKYWTDLNLLPTSSSMPSNKELPTSNWIWATSKWHNKLLLLLFFGNLFLFLRETIIRFELNEIREEIRLFILKEYDPLENTIVRNIRQFKKYDHWKGKKKSIKT